MSTFKLQKFSVKQDVNAMKVCTDSLIFGALAPIYDFKKPPITLDIGTGTGLLSLMVKQQGAWQVTALELFEESANEASYNVSQSPWCDDINVICQDVNSYDSQQPFDLIISNPPFFDHHLKSDDTKRRQARHTDTLNYQQLLTKSHQLLANNGIIFLLLPCHAVSEIKLLCNDLDLRLNKQTDFITMRGGHAKVCALTLSRDNQLPFVHDSITIFESHQQYTQDSARLLQHFLLRFNA